MGRHAGAQHKKVGLFGIIGAAILGVVSLFWGGVLESLGDRAVDASAEQLTTRLAIRLEPKPFDVYPAGYWIFPSNTVLPRPEICDSAGSEFRQWAGRQPRPIHVLDGSYRLTLQGKSRDGIFVDGVSAHILSATDLPSGLSVVTCNGGGFVDKRVAEIDLAGARDPSYFGAMEEGELDGLGLSLTQSESAAFNVVPRSSETSRNVAYTWDLVLHYVYNGENHEVNVNKHLGIPHFRSEMYCASPFRVDGSNQAMDYVWRDGEVEKLRCYR